MAAIIDFPQSAIMAVINSLEEALSLARQNNLAGIALTFVSADHRIHECIKADNAESAVMLLGQTSIVVDDLRTLTRDFRQNESS